MLLRAKALCIPEKWSHAWGELTQIQYGFDATDRLRIEPKDEIRARLGRSPDDADAIALALSRGGGRQPFMLT